MTERTVARLQIIAAAALFSTGGAAIKAVSLDALAVASLRSAFAALAFSLLLVAGRRGWRQPPERYTLDRLGCGVALAYAATMLLFVVANKLTTAANAIFLQSAAPIFVAPLAYLWLREPVARLDLAVMAALAVGMLLFFAGTNTPLVTAPNPFLGNVVASVCALAWALTIVGLRRLEAAGRDSGRTTLLPGNLVLALCCSGFAIAEYPFSLSDWLILAYLGIVQIALGYVFLTRGVRGVPALEASLLLLFEPLLNAGWAWLFHGEKPTAVASTGAVVILVAILGRTMLRPGASAAGMREAPRHN